MLVVRLFGCSVVRLFGCCCLFCLVVRFVRPTTYTPLVKTAVTVCSAKEQTNLELVVKEEADTRYPISLSGYDDVVVMWW